MAGRTNQLRIIGGQWRGRKFQFPDAPSLRPTPDRVRETLFNWLMPVINGARCLDLFAGSGALGLEALSRGAQHCTFVDTQRKVIQGLQQTLTILEASGRTELVQQDGVSFLKSNAQIFDVVFLDPPYQSDFLAQTLPLLEANDCLASEAMIYLEIESHQSLPPLPSNWHIEKDKKAGDVRYFLAQRCTE